MYVLDNNLVDADFNLPDLIVRLNSGSNPGGDGEQRYAFPPTMEACAELQFAYSYFNHLLFGDQLPNCIITYTRKKNVFGYFSPDRFQRVSGSLWAELALNPTYLALREDSDSLSTLVHEQVHVWRHYKGPTNRKGERITTTYHDKHWADKMEDIGLMPSDTGMPGGKRAGHRMTHYIVPGGIFEIACKRLLDEGFQIRWRDRLIFKSGAGLGDPNGSEGRKMPGPKKRDRVKFTCPNGKCNLNAWAKPKARLTCTGCNLPMHSPDSPSTSLITTLPMEISNE